jgi:hypothetical protein
MDGGEWRIPGRSGSGQEIAMSLFLSDLEKLERRGRADTWSWMVGLEAATGLRVVTSPPGNLLLSTVGSTRYNTIMEQ